MLLAALPAFGQGARSSSEEPQTGSIHGTITTSQEDAAAAGLSGISVTLASIPPSGAAQTADTDDSGRFEFK
ncbi:MAG: hypothetical protein WA817_03760, partial [Candidatus Acidiferrum sp.]